jgi:hypothetical protein
VISINSVSCFLVVVIIIISIVGKIALSKPQPSSEDSVRLHPVFTSLDFATEQGH